MSDGFGPDAQIHRVQVTLRDAPDGIARRRLLQVPTAFSLSPDEVSALLEADASVLHHCKEFGALMASLSAPLTASMPASMPPLATQP